MSTSDSDQEASPPEGETPKIVRGASWTLLVLGVLLMIGGPVPLLLDRTFGPEGGNSLGFGLLVWLSWLMGGVLLLAGGVGFVLSRFRRPG